MFHVWKQIQDLWDQGANPIDLILCLHEHSLRYLLMYPILFLSDTLGLPADDLFSIFVIGTWTGTLYLSFIILDRYCSSLRNRNWSFIIMVLFYLPLLFLANGRGILVMLGVMLLFFVGLQGNQLKPREKFLGIASSLLLSSVSTGVLACSSFSLLSLFFLSIWQERKYKPIKVEKSFFYRATKILLLVFFILLLVFLLLQSLIKNYLYYGNILLILDHGIPGVFQNFYYKWLTVLTLVSYTYALYLLFNKLIGNSIIILILFTIGGLFGRLTLLACYPVLLTIILIYINNRLSWKATQNI